MSLKLPPNWEGSVDNNSKEVIILIIFIYFYII